MKSKTWVVRCPECGRLNRVHPEHVRLHRCPFCSEQFFRRAQLEAARNPARRAAKSKRRGA